MDAKLTATDAKEATVALLSAIKRMDDLREAETRRVNELMCLRAEFSEKLGVAEAKRIDAIRAVDVNAVSVANERATAQAAVLANQVAASAETLRSLVAATAATVAQQLAQIAAQLTDRIASLEKSQYENKGTSGGSKDTRTLVIALIMVIVAVAGFLVPYLK